MRKTLAKFLRPFKWKVVFPMFRSSFRNNALNQHLIREYGGSNINRDILLANKTSDTLFVLATGQSINNLSGSEFDFIRKHDSIGVNGFGYHDFVPNFYSFELENQDNPIPLKMFLDVANRIQSNMSEYTQAVFIFRQNPILNEELGRFLRKMFSIGNSYWNVYDVIPGDNINEYENYLKWYERIGMFKLNDFFPNKSSSLSWIISMAYQMDYKHIVLCGVDLCGDHFYKNSNPVDDKTFQNNSQKLHRTGNAEENGIAIQDIIEVWNKNLFSKNGSTVYTASEYSLLANILPVYKFPKS